MGNRTRFGLGLLLTALAGWIDAIGFISLGGFYVSFMSGNTTQLGIGLTRFDMSLVRLPAVLLAFFVLGAFAGTLLHSLSGRWHLPAILVLEGVLLGLALAFSFFQTPTLGATAPLAIAMGTDKVDLRDPVTGKLIATPLETKGLGGNFLGGLTLSSDGGVAAPHAAFGDGATEGPEPADAPPCAATRFLAMASPNPLPRESRDL